MTGFVRSPAFAPTSRCSIPASSQSPGDGLLDGRVGAGSGGVLDTLHALAGLARVDDPARGRTRLRARWSWLRGDIGKAGTAMAVSAPVYHNDTINLYNDGVEAAWRSGPAAGTTPFDVPAGGWSAQSSSVDLPPPSPPRGRVAAHVPRQSGWAKGAVCTTAFGPEQARIRQGLAVPAKRIVVCGLSWSTCTPLLVVADLRSVVRGVAFSPSTSRP